MTQDFKHQSFFQFLGVGEKNVAIPFGSALGFSLGSVLGQHYGWRMAFLVMSLSRYMD